jgi:uncharacterized membrane protein YhaH (DUF805 family)
VAVNPEKPMWHLPLLMIPIFGLAIMKFEGVQKLYVYIIFLFLLIFLCSRGCVKIWCVGANTSNIRSDYLIW